MAAFNKYMTGLDIIRAVCAQLGVAIPTMAVADSNNMTAQQLVSLLTSEGRRMLKPQREHRWQVLNSTWVFDTVPGQTIYPLPADWDSFIDMTAWNQTARLPLMGPASDPQWATMVARSLGPGTIQVVYRVRGNQFEIYSSPSAAQTLRIDYTSRGWVQASGTTGTGAAVTKDWIEKDDDIILLDGELMCAALKLRWLTEKGFDTAASMNDFDLALELAINADTGATPLAMGRSAGPALIGACNVGDTNYGL